MREGKADFWLVRRGDRSFKDKQMELISFVRARKASMGEPGEARSQDANTLLKVQVDHEGNYFFQQKDIFVEEWMEANENQEEEVFKRFYGAVWFADRLAQRYEQLKKQFKEENFDILTVIRNGKWYFTATLVQLLNDFSSCKNGDGSIIPDFSKFHGALEDIEENLSKGILCFAKILVHIALKRSYGKLDSNFFKKSECYHDLIQNLQQVWELDKSAQIENFEGKDMEEVRLTELFREFISLFNKNELDRKGLLESGIKGDYIKLGIDQITIDSIADAMEKTVGYILKQYPQVSNSLTGSIAKWLTDDENIVKQKDGYFRGTPREIRVRGAVYWLGTSSNTTVKVHQMQRLCNLANVNRNKIIWYQESAGRQVFSW